MAGLVRQPVQVGYGGFNKDQALGYIGATQGRVVQNFLVDRDGRLPLRGPAEHFAMLTLGTQSPAGAISMYTKSPLGEFKSPSHLIGYQDTVPALNGGLPATTTAHFIDQTGTVTPITIGTDRCPSRRYAQLADFVWSFSSWGIEGLAIARALLKWDGTATQPTQPNTNFNEWPQNGKDIVTYLNRLFILGAEMNNGSDPNFGGPNSLMYSDVGGPLTGSDADWKDNVSGLVNQIVIGADDDDYGVGLGVIPGGLVVLKQHSLWLLSGRTPAAFQVTKITSDVGCVDVDSIISLDDRVLFLSANGYMSFDGLKVENYSTAANQSEIRELVAYEQGRGNGYGQYLSGAYARAAYMGNDYVMLSLGFQSTTTHEVSDAGFVAMLHVPTRRWTKFQHDGFRYTAGGQVVAYLGHGPDIMAFDTKSLFRVNPCTIPSPLVDVDARAGYDFNGSDYYAIPAKFYSRMIRPGSPADFAQLHRVLLDHRFLVQDSEDIGANAWTVRIVGAGGNELMPPTRGVSIHETKGLTQLIQRDEFDSFPELADIEIQVEWPTGGPFDAPTLLVREAELYDLLVEFQITRQT